MVKDHKQDHCDRLSSHFIVNVPIIFLGLYQNNLIPYIIDRFTTVFGDKGKIF